MRQSRRRSKRLLLVFALSVLIPALALAWLAWQSVAKEKRALEAERVSGLQRAAWLIRTELHDELDSLLREEDGRPWFHYNSIYFDANFVGKGTNYIPSPIALAPSNFLVEGYFNVDNLGQIRSPNDVPPALQQKWQVSQGGQSAQTLEAMRDDRVEQQERTRRTVDRAARNLKEEIEDLKATPPQQAQGVFPGIAESNRKQQMSAKSVAANVQTAKQLEQILHGQQEDVQWSEEEAGKSIEITVSPFVLKKDEDDVVMAYRYVDVPNARQAYGNRPFLRYLQGFTLDREHLTEVLFPGLVDRYLDVEGARAALVLDGGDAPEGRVVFEDGLGRLPSYRLVVTDADEGWVDRRVSRLSLVLMAVAGGLLLVIFAGLGFTVRTVRTELDLAGRKSDFVAAVTHELRTPLTGIKMYADMLQAGWVKDKETRREYVGFMAQETDRLARLVNRVLDFARTDKADRREEPVDLCSVIDEVERDFGPFLSGKGFTVVKEIEDDRRPVGDPDAVKQILLNLLENAAKYASDADDRTITVAVSPEGAATVLSVVDHGPGVPERERERIFEDFYRPGEELTRESPGAGIGLALVRRLAESMGGSVGVTETPGGGATFRVTLRV